MRPLKALIALPLVLALAGCFGSAPPVPKEQYFRLIASAPAEQAATPITGGVEVIPFAGEGVMSERPLLFTADGGRKLEQRNYAYWTDAPPQMLRDQLVAYLRQANVADSVSPSELRLDTAYVVRGTIKRLEQLTGGQSGAVISLELACIEKNGDRLLLSKTYTSEKPTSGEKIDDAVAALNAGLDEIFAAFAKDLAAAR
ncbi:MAG TPA: ABC-type transport auxiliary lipoprotein family protein [Alphaproteobacteria bacterium]|nr:ABC-type transport auxiliary lipoprotein family protein [Alphaproteobacteria bacterium]